MDYRIEAEITYFHTIPLQLLIADAIKIGEVICFRRLPTQHYTKNIAIVLETIVPPEAVEQYLKNQCYPEHCPTTIVVRKFTTYVTKAEPTPLKNKEPSPAILDQKRLVIQLPGVPMTEEEWTTNLLATFIKFGGIEYLTVFLNKKTNRKTAFLRYLSREAAKKAMNAKIDFPRSIANERKRKATSLPKTNVLHPECGYKVDRDTLHLHVKTCRLIQLLELHEPIDTCKRQKLSSNHPENAEATPNNLSLEQLSITSTTDATPATTADAITIPGQE